MNIKGAEPAVRSPSPAAERMRGYRQRRRREWRSVRIEISAVEIDALMKRRYLDPKDRDDLTAIGEAATAFISDARNVTFDRLEVDATGVSGAKRHVS